ncbi:MAG: PilZ domain-containing protein [Deltaproteobacteria bacterium]|nr:PilZ domain-containing protein [Deltaproteobacteria bacterium]
MQFKQRIDDKRKSVRIDFKVPVEISYSKSDKVFKGVLVNLSVHGMLVDLQVNITGVAADHKGSCTAKLIFSGKGSRLMIDELESTVVRCNNSMLALEFSEPLEWFLLFSVYKSKQIDE